MSFRTVVISSHCKLEYSLNYLVYKTVDEIKRLKLFKELSQYIDGMQKTFHEDKYLQEEFAKAQIMTHIINKETYLIDNKVDVFGIPHYARIVYGLENTSCYKISKKRR